MKYATIMLPQVQMLLVIMFFQNFSVFNFLVTGKRTWKRKLDFCSCCLIQTACLEYCTVNIVFCGLDILQEQGGSTMYIMPSSTLEIKSLHFVHKIAHIKQKVVAYNSLPPYQWKLDTSALTGKFGIMSDRWRPGACSTLRTCIDRAGIPCPGRSCKSCWCQVHHWAAYSVFGAAWWAGMHNFLLFVPVWRLFLIATLVSYCY